MKNKPVHYKSHKLRGTPESLNNQVYLVINKWRRVTASVW